jgi:plasmid maintenance system killer protein
MPTDLVLDDSQYRVCFSWKDGYADEVEITDYH